MEEKKKVMKTANIEEDRLKKLFSLKRYVNAKSIDALVGKILKLISKFKLKEDLKNLK